jgi:hypothetical protein
MSSPAACVVTSSCEVSDEASRLQCAGPRIHRNNQQENDMLKDINENERETVDGGGLAVCVWFSPVPIITTVVDGELCIGLRVPA